MKNFTTIKNEITNLINTELTNNGATIKIKEITLWSEYNKDGACWVNAEVNNFGNTENMEMKIEFDEEGYYHITSDISVVEYYGKIKF